MISKESRCAAHMIISFVPPPPANVKVQKLEGIGDIEGLRLLYLDGLDIEGPLPDELFDLTDLRILHLQHGSFSGPLPSKVGQLSNLELWVYFF